MEISEFIKIFASERRNEVLDALYKGERAEKIRARFPGSTFAFTIDYLKKAGMIQETGRELSLTDKGRAYILIFGQARESLQTYSKIIDFFHDHIVYFPEEFLPRLYEISNFEAVASEPSDILKPHRIFAEHIQKSNEIFGVSPLLFPDYPQIFGGMVKRVRKISLVVTEEIMKILSDYPLHEYDNVEIFIVEKTPMIALTVTDRFLSIGFFYKSGSYDFTRDLISRSPSAIRFGRGLVDYYKAQSRRIK